MKISEITGEISCAEPGIFVGKWNGFNLNTVQVGENRVALQLTDEVTGIKCNSASVKGGKTLGGFDESWGTNSSRIIIPEDYELISGSLKITDVSLNKTGAEFLEVWPDKSIRRKMDFREFVFYFRMKSLFPVNWFLDTKVDNQIADRVEYNLMETKKSIEELVDAVVQDLTDHFHRYWVGNKLFISLDNGFIYNVSCGTYSPPKEPNDFFTIGRMLEIKNEIEFILGRLSSLSKNYSIHARLNPNTKEIPSEIKEALDSGNSYTLYLLQEYPNEPLGWTRLFQNTKDGIEVSLNGSNGKFIEWKGKQFSWY